MAKWINNMGRELEEIDDMNRLNSSKYCDECSNVYCFCIAPLFEHSWVMSISTVWKKTKSTVLALLVELTEVFEK